MSHGALQIESEDELFDHIWQKVSEEDDYFRLFEFVRFEYLSCDSVDRFCETCGGFFSPLNCAIWNAISRRLVLPVTPSAPHRKGRSRSREIHLAFSPDAPLGGIIAHLTAQCGGNVDEKGVVHVFADHAYGRPPAYPARNVADLYADSYFYSKNEPNQSITYDFKGMRVVPTDYTIRSNYSGGVNDCNLKSWAIEVSEDGEGWVEIDRRENNYDLNSKNVVKSFKAEKPAEGRFVRLRQTGENHRGDHLLIFSAFEIFGTLIESAQVD
jgi:hypothetical protein